MKKCLFAFAAILLTSFVSNAQIRFGANAGANFTNLMGKDVESDPQPGFYIGAHCAIPLTEKLNLIPALRFSAEGAKEDFLGTTFHLNTSFINIPVLLNYQTGKLFFEVGPQAGLLISSKMKVDGDSEDVKEEFNSMNFSAAAGAGYMITNNIGVNLRLNIGLVNIEKESDETISMSGLQLGVLYTFGSAKEKK